MDIPDFGGCSKGLWIVLGVCLLLSGCSVTSDSDNHNPQFSYSESFTFNFSADSVSITVQQYPGEIERSELTEPKISIADSNLSAGQIAITFEVQAFDIPDKPAEPSTEFSAFSDSLYIWYSANSRSYFRSENKQKGDQPTIHTAPAVPALPIKRIDIRKNSNLKTTITYINND